LHGPADESGSLDCSGIPDASELEKALPRNYIRRPIQMKARSSAIKIVVAVLMLTSASLWAQDGLKGALARMSLTVPAGLKNSFSQTLAASDFDGGDRPDGAVLFDSGGLQPQSSVHRIELHFTSHGNGILTFESNETALAISARDVNGDGAPDIVVEQSLTHKRLHIWLNDGRGGFREGRIEDFPSAGSTTGERLDSPDPRPYSSSLWLVLQRGSEIAALPARQPLYQPSSASKRTVLLGSPTARCAVAPNAPRAPPVLRSA
jgi:hypothetical protein